MSRSRPRRQPIRLAGPLLALIALPGLRAVAAQDDVVELEDGHRVEGRIVYQDDELVVLRRGSRDREIPRREIARIVSTGDVWAELLEESRSVPVRAAEANAELARRAAEAGLEEASRLFWWRTLIGDPEHEEAHEELGHRRRSGRWSARVGGRFVAFEKLDRMRSDWGEAWEMETPRYRLRTNAGLRAAVELALDLERLYQAFFQLFGQPLRLYEVEEPMAVHVHADDGSFPEISGGTVGYFSPSDRTIRIRTEPGRTQPKLLHEAVHQLLWYTAVHERSYSGDLPGWLEEGLAHYVATAAADSGAGLRFEWGRKDPRLFAVHATSKDPYGLNRVLNFETGDFYASSKRTLKYAQSYTLVHFLLQGNEGLFRDGFFEFLRGVYQGRSSPTHFQNALGIDGEEDEFERVWFDYVGR